MSIKTHVKSRGNHPAYPPRFYVPDDKVNFDIEYDEYNPVKFTHKVVLDNDNTIKSNGWADPQKYESLTDLATRFSYLSYACDPKTKLPLNPFGRTGMIERGLLGKWGPNHAADPIVSRKHNNKQQIVVIKRKDTGEWALPGGMVDPGETITQTLKREFEEEAGNVKPEEKNNFNILMEKLFANGKKIYSGYVDDPRNTDNAWMETVAVHFECDDELGEKLNFLRAGDDAVDVKWLDVDQTNDEYNKLYASHRELVNTTFGLT